MNAADRSVNMLHISSATLLSHLYAQNNQKRTWLLDYYIQLRQLKIHGSTPLKELFPTLPRPLKVLLAKILLLTPYPKLGFFGSPDPHFLSDVKKLLALVETKQQIEHDFSVIFSRLLKNKAYAQPVLRHLCANENTLINRAEKLLRHSPLVAFATNVKALELAALTKTLFDIVKPTIPGSFRKASYHLNLFKSAFLTAEIAVPDTLLEDIRSSYKESFKDFIPFGVFYSLCYQTTLGMRRVPNLENMGFLLGFRGSKAERNSYIKRHRGRLGFKISAIHDLRYDRVCEVVHHGVDTNHAFRVLDEKVFYEDIRNIPKMSNSYNIGYVKNGTQTEEVLGKSRGTWIVDHNSQHYNQLKPQHHYTFPYEILYLTPRTRLTTTLKSSAFTRGHFQARAFHRITDINAITKPDTSKRPAIQDRRWQAPFDEYLASDFTLEALLPILLKDDIFFQRIKTKLKKLSKKLKGQTLNTLTADDFKKLKIYYDGFEIENHLDQKSLNVDDDEERVAYALYKSCLHLWIKEFKNPLLPGKVTLTLKKADSATKSRTVCRSPILLSIFESFANRIFQVIYQKMNRDVFNYSVSNYLPGLAVPMFTMERFKKSLQGKDFAMCNMDVKSCFDTINLKHPNFLPRLEIGLQTVETLVSKKAANFLRFILKDYLYDNLVINENFVFKKSTSKSLTPSAALPKDGTLPTGFVLSPALWLVLALPALVETEERRKEGSLFSYDLCGDDFIALAPRDLREEDKEQICKPWFELSKALDLKFHFFKNYKDRRVYFDPKWDSLFSGREEQQYKSAWIDAYPAYSVPVYHAGTVLARKSFVETTTGLEMSKLEAKLYSALNKRKRENTANFIPRNVVETLKGHQPLASRLGASQASKCLRDQGEASLELERFLTGSQSYSGTFFVQEEGGEGSRYLAAPASLLPSS